MTQLTYYSAYEFHTRFEKDNKGSRASGFLVRGNQIYALYFLGDHNMRWAEVSEEHFREQILHETLLQQGYGKGPDFAANYSKHGLSQFPAFRYQKTPKALRL